MSGKRKLSANPCKNVGTQNVSTISPVKPIMSSGGVPPVPANDVDKAFVNMNPLLRDDLDLRDEGCDTMTRHGPEAMETEGILAPRETVFCLTRDTDSHVEVPASKYPAPSATGALGGSDDVSPLVDGIHASLTLALAAGNRERLVSVMSTIDDIDSSHESELSASSRCNHVGEPRLAQRPAGHTKSQALQAEPLCHNHLDCHLADGNESGSAGGSSGASSGSGCSRYRPPDSPPHNAHKQHWMDAGIAFYTSEGRSCVEICCQQVCLQ